MDNGEATRSRIGRREFLGGLGGAVLLAGMSRGGVASAEPNDEDESPSPSGGATGFHMGAGLHFGRWGRFDQVLEEALEQVEQAGATSFRDDFSWDKVELEKGVLLVPPDRDRYVRRAAALGLEPILILGYGNPFYDNFDRPTSEEAIEAFVRYAEFLAQHFKGVVNTFEVWNEWDIKIGGGGISGGGTPEDYMRLLKAVYPRLKQVNPDITVVSTSMTNKGIYNGFLDGLLEGGVLEYCDVLGAHPYVWGELTPADRRPEAWWNAMQNLGGKLRQYNGGEDFPVYITEIGWPSHIPPRLPPRGVTQELQAAYCSRLYALARTLPFIRGVWFYEFQDKGFKYGDSESNYGLVWPDLTPKEAYHAYRGVSDLIVNGAYEERLETPDPEIWALRFRAPRGRSRSQGPDVLVLWSAYLDDEWSVVLRKDGGGLGGLTLEQVGRPALERDWGRNESLDAPVIPNEIAVTLRRMPLLIRGDLDRVSLVRVTRREFPELVRPRDTPES